MKNIKCSTFSLDFLFAFSIWHGKVTVIFVRKMNVFNFPFIYAVFLLKKFLKMAEILLAPTPSVTSVLCWSSLSSTDKSGELWLSVEKLFVQLGYSNFLKRRSWQTRVIQKHERCCRREKNSLEVGRSKLVWQKQKSFHIYGILNAIHAWSALLCMSLFFNTFRHAWCYFSFKP